MCDILFRQKLEESQTAFLVGDLFSSELVAKSLHRVLPPSGLSITPKSLYAEVKEIAKARFDVDLPNDQKKLLCLQSVHSKTSLLRDICKTIGV
jgi:hypothetical protein